VSVLDSIGYIKEVGAAASVKVVLSSLVGRLR
jgi:hypothetical protein